MTDIAHAAGVGRVTLYAHFPSREDLVDAVVERSLAESAELIQVDGFDTAPADEVLVRLVRSSWQALHRHRRIRLVAQAELGEQRLKARHERAEVAARLNRLIARGQDEGTIRSDLPVSWLVSTFFGILHTAADEVDAGWLAAEDAPAIIEATLLPALLTQPTVGDAASRQQLSRSRS
jgi:AcrR family transcriptional regulator